MSTPHGTRRLSAGTLCRIRFSERGGNMTAAHTAARTEFRDIVTTMDELRALVGVPGDGASRKDIARIDPHARAFIERSPFALFATSAADGRCDVSPRGDGPG